MLLIKSKKNFYKDDNIIRSNKTNIKKVSL